MGLICSDERGAGWRPWSRECKRIKVYIFYQFCTLRP